MIHILIVIISIFFVYRKSKVFAFIGIASWVYIGACNTVQHLFYDKTNAVQRNISFTIQVCNSTSSFSLSSLFMSQILLNSSTEWLPQWTLFSLCVTCRSLSANWPHRPLWLATGELFHFLAVWLGVDRFSLTRWFETESQRREQSSAIFVCLPLKIQR